MRELILILAMFVAAQLIGIYTASSLLAMPGYLEKVSVGETLDPFLMLGYVLAGALFFLMLIKFYKGVLIFRVLEGFVIFFASFLVFFAFTRLEIFSAACSLVLVLMKFTYPKVRNAAAVLASAGVGAVFGLSLGLWATVLFVVFLSIYDFISVFVTKHMIFMAKELSRRKVSFLVSASGRELNPKTGKMEKVMLELGTGDMAVPLMLSVSAFEFSGELLTALSVTLGACIALFIILVQVKRSKKFLPALPMIAAFSLIFLALSLYF